MQADKFYLKNQIQSKIIFNKDMETVYQLSYFLVDFQAIINNFIEMDMNRTQAVISKKFSCAEKVEIIEEKRLDKKELPEVENSINEQLLEDLSYRVVKERLKQTTNRSFNRKYQTNLYLRDFSKGSLCIDVVNSLLVSVLTEFLKELVFKRTGKTDLINITITNSVIYIADSIVKVLPAQSNISNAIKLDIDGSTSILDVKKCAHDIVESARPSDNIEESVERFLLELKNNNLINENVIYDSRGIKTAVRDIERFVGYFVDVSI